MFELGPWVLGYLYVGNGKALLLVMLMWLYGLILVIVILELKSFWSFRFEKGKRSICNEFDVVICS